MAGSTRIPKAELTGIYGAIVRRMSHKMFGDVPEPGHVNRGQGMRCRCADVGKVVFRYRFVVAGSVIVGRLDRRRGRPGPSVHGRER